ncbi:MAG: 3-deoxy-manno-octulosonate cytidylyltransferase [Alphaproteobacteria bacterium]
MKTCVIIPCRMASERLPEKFIQDINGKTLLQRVYENVSAEFGKDDVFIALDGEKLAALAQSFGAKFIITDPNCPSGTDRIAQALETIDPNGDKYDFVINFQGDDVNVNPKISSRLAQILEKTGADLATVVQPIDDENMIMNPSIVKVAMVQSTGRCLYFSRSPIPFNRKVGCTDKAFWHIGMYAYNLKSLRKFVKLPVGELEKLESLEQLRFLENGMSVFAGILEDTRINTQAPADVNTAEDLEEMRKYIK